jgi:RNA polymerase sigma factor for flagellar operon FliA
MKRAAQLATGNRKSKRSSARFNSVYAAPPGVSDRGALIEAHLPQVKFIVDRIAARLPRSVDRDDLIGAGLLGLLDAAAKYDPARGVQFKTYAEWRVRGAVLDSLRTMDCASRSVRRRAREVEAAYTQIENKYGRPATEEEVAELLSVSLPEFQELLAELSWLTVASLDEEDDNGNGGRALQIPGDPDLLPSAIFERTEEREQLTEAIDRLPPRERQVVALYYVGELTMKEIGAIFGVTESRICQIHTAAVLHLRTALAFAGKAASSGR